ncbi:solute carrier family 45 member 3-like [Dreissena polymorpha]|uniref:Uncharacterized protein n=1 Tax=Dreissena polymorpha TaxID=45954 RepID=A0A9D4RQE1_DREPO|nr:solute carrier family 45 member 3-like [Dreissena polymorpha]KAH3877606.1 hypothetical protein DPMN_001481 [Dreissena polymorpha]
MNDKEGYLEVRSRIRAGSVENMLLEPTLQVPLVSSSIPAPIPEMVTIGSKGRRISLGMVQIFLLNAIVCGVEICACAGFTYIPPMLLKTGYSEENMSIILGLGPLMGFFLVPVIGRASDRCRSSLGRRRPFIIGLSSLLIMSLVLVPYADVLCTNLFGTSAMSRTMAVMLLTFGVVMLDFTSQACLTPCEALISDATMDSDQEDRAFIVYSLMVSLGGFLGYLITAIDWNTTNIGMYFKNQEKTVFTILGCLFSVMLMATLIAAKELPLQAIENNQKVEGESEESHFNSGANTLQEICSNGGESGYDTNGSENGALMLQGQKPNSSQMYASKRTRMGKFMALPKSGLGMLLSCRMFASIVNLFRLLWINIHDKLPEPFKKLLVIPHVLRHLALAHFFSWTSVMGFNLFFTDYVANAVYQGDPNAPEDSPLRVVFDEGVRMGSWGLLIHCVTSAIYALLIERLVTRYGCKLTYSIGMASLVCSMFGMVLFKNVVFVLVMAALTGIAYATVTTIPFILVTKYHSEKQTYFFDAPSNSNTERGIATDIATLDSAYFLSQVVLSCTMSSIVYITGSQSSYMVTAGVMGILSIVFIQNIITAPAEMTTLKQSLSVL